MGEWQGYSYGYLYGWSAQQMTAWYFLDFSETQNWPTANAIGIACDVASWHLVEKIALRLKRVFFQKPAASTIIFSLNFQGAKI